MVWIAIGITMAVVHWHWMSYRTVRTQRWKIARGSPDFLCTKFFTTHYNCFTKIFIERKSTRCFFKVLNCSVTKWNPRLMCRKWTPFICSSETGLHPKPGSKKGPAWNRTCLEPRANERWLLLFQRTATKRECLLQFLIFLGNLSLTRDDQAVVYACVSKRLIIFSISHRVTLIHSLRMDLECF